MTKMKINEAASTIEMTKMFYCDARTSTLEAIKKMKTRAKPTA